MVKFETTNEEFELVNKIISRAKELNIVSKDVLSDQMDIVAAHSNGTPLDFQKFLDFDEFNFMHDYFGIRNNIDRKSGELKNCFLPRCSK